MSKWGYRLAAVFWMLFIFWLSSLPGGSLPTSFWGSDKLAHAGAYAVLGALYARSMWPALKGRRALVVLLSALGAALYGVSDELHQLYVPGREASWGDLAADFIGGSVGAALFSGEMAPLLPPRYPPGRTPLGKKF